MIDNPIIIQNIIQLLSIKDILNLEISLNKKLDDTFWRYKSIHMFGNEFWNKAHSRPKYSSLPLTTWKEELLRIENFQFLLEKTFDFRWSVQDFYLYWDKLDKLKNTFNI